MRKSEEEQGTKLVRFMWGILLGGVLALLVCLAVLLICSVGISGGWISDRHMVQCTFVGCVLGSFVGGMFAVLRCRARTLLVGLGAGAFFSSFCSRSACCSIPICRWRSGESGCSVPACSAVH